MQGLQEQQSLWSIPDPLLRSNMKDALAEDFLPVYKVHQAASSFSIHCLCCPVNKVYQEVASFSIHCVYCPVDNVYQRAT